MKPPEYKPQVLSPNVKYLLCPGWVLSATDDDEHFISAEKLARLYKVPMSQCEVKTSPCENLLHQGLIELHPDCFGNYQLPAK